MADSFQAVLKSVRITPRKARLVADVVRGKPVSNALDVLKFTNKKAARILLKVLHSAVANATDKATVDVDRLIVSEIFVDGGPTWKRFMPRAQGRAAPILKRTSHITVRLTEL